MHVTRSDVMQPLNFAGKKKEAFFTRVVRSGENLVNPAVPLLQICYRRWVILAARYLWVFFSRTDHRCSSRVAHRPTDRLPLPILGHVNGPDERDVRRIILSVPYGHLADSARSRSLVRFARLPGARAGWYTFQCVTRRCI